jgi:TrmH family RNA methyltransferase
MTLITSRQHPVCKLIRSLHNARDRKKHGLFVVEGGNAVTAAIRMRWPIQRLFAAPEDMEAGWEDVARTAGVETQALGPDLLEYLSESQTSPEVIALAHLPAPTGDDWSVDGLLLVLDGISDPGNAGTLLRAADAAGAGGVILTANSTDAYSPKVVRASAGSLFHVPPLQPQENTPEAVVAALAERNIPIVTGVAHGGVSCFEYAWQSRCALVLGHETRGVSEAFELAATARVTVPIHGRAESLNVAMAGTVLMYAWQQRQGV